MSAMSTEQCSWHFFRVYLIGRIAVFVRQEVCIFMNQSALTGIKVLEYSEMVSGPYCAKLLADLGAEVLKIEKPDIGDGARDRGPFLNDTPHPERSGLFLYLNTNKSSITLDPAKKAGREIFLELVRWADVLIEDTTPGTMTDLGLGYDVLSDRPRAGL